MAHSSNQDGDRFTCGICYDEKSRSRQQLKLQGCTHSYCSDCVCMYVDAKLQDNVSHIRCPVPGCQGCLDPLQCRPLLPKAVFDRWGDALCEAVIEASDKFYCPFRDCSALLEDDEKAEIQESECPECRRLFCARCRVPWHSDISCQDFQSLNDTERQGEDLELMKFARGKDWKRCPSCRIFVDRISGCDFLSCRCGCAFCYKCGAPAANHICPNCGQITLN
ncbi:unnamed protein product [Cuscuta epithymum]|uniref:RBR-type E3 ubiquitin transferase n=1 Tax=Cuscuta epithymum TaxID=186058 RepID=A0AAV0G1V7_9ASTE|nr:unnamed protein product [Cuscuta epithymum]